MASLNDKDVWRGNLDMAIAMSIHDAGLSLVDLTNDSEAGPSGAMKDEPVDEPDERGKQDVVVNDIYNFHQYYDPSGRQIYVIYNKFE
jgi:hypothetical protein